MSINVCVTKDGFTGSNYYKLKIMYSIRFSKRKLHHFPCMFDFSHSLLSLYIVHDCFEAWEIVIDLMSLHEYGKYEA